MPPAMALGVETPERRFNSSTGSAAGGLAVKANVAAEVVRTHGGNLSGALLHVLDVAHVRKDHDVVRVGKLDGGAKGGVIGGAQDAEHVAAGLDARLGNLAAAVHDLDVGKDGLGGIGVLDGADGAGASATMSGVPTSMMSTYSPTCSRILIASSMVKRSRATWNFLSAMLSSFCAQRTGTAVFAKAFASHRAERMAMPSVAFEPIGKRRLNVC